MTILTNFKLFFNETFLFEIFYFSARIYTTTEVTNI